MSLRIIQRMWTRSCSFFVRPVLMTDSFPKARRAKPPMGPPRLPYRSDGFGQFLSRRGVGPERSSWPSLFQTSPDISNGLSPTQDQANQGFPSSANLTARHLLALRAQAPAALALRALMGCAA